MRGALRKWRRQLRFAGPDATQTWHQPEVHFCFSFLKTGPAPQSETQPCSLDGQVWLLGDVRLDARDELIRRCAQLGERLENTATDEELVLRVFHVLVKAGVAELDGDYSIVLWDNKTKEFLGFRDLTGSKPFFYYLRARAYFALATRWTHCAILLDLTERSTKVSWRIIC